MAQMALADVYLWLDDTNFSRGSLTNRIQVRTPAGHTWMTIPLAGRGSFQKINQLEAAHDHWKQSHRDLLRQQLRDYPHLQTAIALFEHATAPESVCDCLIASCETLARDLGVLPRRILRTSELRIDGSSWQRVLKLVRYVDGTHYITAHGAADYLDHVAFEEAGVAVSYMDYRPIPWPQQHGNFTPYTTSLDLIAAVGREACSHLSPATIDWRTFLQQRTEQPNPRR
jgi:hypothetical protein